MSDTIPEIWAPATFVDAYGDTLTVTGGSDITLHPIYTSDLDTNMLCFTRAEAKSLRDRLTALLDAMEGE